MSVYIYGRFYLILERGFANDLSINFTNELLFLLFGVITDFSVWILKFFFFTDNLPT